MKPIAAPMVGGMNTSTIHVLILFPVFFLLMKERAFRRGNIATKRSTFGYRVSLQKTISYRLVSFENE
jgi:Cu(I)/Ag(I) efflux system membrane protein CusA/SilA